MLYVESPVGVGFSYSDTVKDYITGDNKTMIDSYHFLLKWFEAFPEFSSETRKFYISGESYGGHYVPQLAWTIHNLGGIKLEGFLVGNAWTDNVLDTNSVPTFIYSHGLCSFETWLDVDRECNITHGGSFSKLYQHGPFRDYKRRTYRGKTPECDKAVNMMFSEVGDNINQYDIYALCLPNQDKSLPCTNYTKEETYINSMAVKQAIHAKTNLRRWSICTEIEYVEYWDSVVHIYPELLQYDILVFAGDVTYNVPYFGSQWWIRQLNFPIIYRWKNWMVDGQVAGYIEKYKGLVFATVKHSGHMVPASTPKAAFVLFQNYLNGSLS